MGFSDASANADTAAGSAENAKGTEVDPLSDATLREQLDKDVRAHAKELEDQRVQGSEVGRMDPL